MDGLVFFFFLILVLLTYNIVFQVYSKVIQLCIYIF